MVTLCGSSLLQFLFSLNFRLRILDCLSSPKVQSAIKSSRSPVVALGGDTRRIALSAAARKESVHSLTMTLPF